MSLAPPSSFASWTAGRLLLLLAGVLLTPALTQGQNVEFRQVSSPQGIVNQTTFPALNSVAVTVTAPETASGSRFTHWTLNGIRRSDPAGTGMNPVSFTIIQATEAVASYTPEAQDNDGDGLPDWYELRYFASLSQTPQGDFDGDGFSNELERSIGQHPGVVDLREQGGISRRRGAVFNVVPGVGDPGYYYGGISRRRSGSTLVILNPAMVRLDETSEPAGLITPQTRVLTAGATESLTSVPASASGYRFTGWFVNGARFDVPPRMAPFSITVSQHTATVARYVQESLDSDGDGIADWIEWYSFDSLQYDLSSDPDGDGLSWAVEVFRGTSLVARNHITPGGFSRRRSAMIEVDTTGRLAFRTTSLPASIVEQTQLISPGTVVNVPDRANQTSANYKFAWWDLNGVRQTDASGAAVGAFSFTLTQASTATAHYFDPTLDTDTDGLNDWQEQFYYGTLAGNAAGDTDGDGFTILQEMTYGQSPRVVDTRAAGGISRRRGALIPLNAILLDIPPVVGAASAINITPTGATLTGVVNPAGTLSSVYYEWGTTATYDRQTSVQNIGNGLLSVTTNVQLAGLTPGTEYHFRLVASNARGVTNGEDIVFVTRAPGYAEWAAEHTVGAPQEDPDADGVSNVLEYAFGLNPRSALSREIPEAVWQNGQLRLDFSPARTIDDLLLNAEISTDLTHWTALSDSDSGPRYLYSTPAGPAGEPLFIRWKIIY